MNWMWLSFADPDLPKGSQFLGACIVEGDNVLTAALAAHILGINPGGECVGVGPITEAKLDALDPRKTWRHRLLSRAECEEFDRQAMAS